MRQIIFNGYNGKEVEEFHNGLEYIPQEGEIKFNGKYYKANTTFLVDADNCLGVIDDSTWDEVKDAVNGVFKATGEFTKRFPDTDVVAVVFDNALPQALDKALQLAFIHNLDRNSVDCQVMLNGYEQLKTKGWIGDGC
ncbi:hypothetical protein phiST2_0095 [Vibrio phage phi-ST2]|uniref:Uncharacterized protein n=1 Tax=Vibrio phage VH7D TaxID=1262539 RepID=V9LZZ5_9CAUD|nr:hypothetical protein CF80_gp116 [Vibrio phage VH7D]AGB06903.1 hypothetical protein [Vibrio phage VH7D]ALP47532.1 hypothetical protein phiST2_0095 [Vibrio phage phi-ST2]QNJ54869.1 hypothetical protein vBValMR10Z_329 [Vibrio phage vB_ValM_R10Z]